MSIKRVKQIQKENDKKRRLGLVGPDVSDETMLSALRKAEKSLQVEQTASKSRRPRLRRSKNGLPYGFYSRWYLGVS